MENNNRAFEALRKIEKVIEEIKDLFSNPKKLGIKNISKKYDDPLKMLKRINGIITNYDETNAERKLKSLFQFLGIVSHDDK